MEPRPERVTAYLASLQAASHGLPADIADELLADVRSHLDEVVAADAGEAAIRQAIDDLGSPEQIVAAARRELLVPAAEHTDAHLGSEAPRSSPVRSRAPRAGGTGGRGTGRDALTVFLLLLGPVLAFTVAVPVARTTGNLLVLVLAIVTALTLALGGTVLLWTAHVWTTNEKLLGTLVWPGGLLAPLALGLLPTQSCVTDLSTGQEICTGFALPAPLGPLLLVALVVAPVVVAVMLLRRAGRRRATDAGTAIDATAPG